MKQTIAWLFGVALAALFLCGSPAAQTNEELYELRCGSVGSAFNILEEYFTGRWNARRAQLHETAANNYLEYHDVKDRKDVAVYVFQSRFFKAFAVVVARPVSSDRVMCIVKIDGRLHKEYLPDELHEILSTEKAI
jgi:hypothetical protein